MLKTNTNNQLTYRQILGWNKPIRRQAPLPGGKPACSRFPRLGLFHLSALSIEQLVISIKGKTVTIYVAPDDDDYYFIGIPLEKLLYMLDLNGIAYTLNFNPDETSAESE